jgi:DNA-binding HxlR family transcriptional regulator
MTTPNNEALKDCPSEQLLKLLAGKWKPCIFRYASYGPVRFNELLRLLPDSSKQSITVALRDMEKSGILERKVIKEKPLHVEYHLTDTGRMFIPVFKMLEDMKLVPPALPVPGV